MTKFEQIGVNMQFDAKSADDAKSLFDYSCKCCCETGRYSDCKRCAIEYTHRLMIAYFNDKKTKTENDKEKYNCKQYNILGIFQNTLYHLKTFRPQGK